MRVAEGLTLMSNRSRSRSKRWLGCYVRPLISRGCPSFGVPLPRIEFDPPKSRGICGGSKMIGASRQFRRQALSRITRP